MTNRIRATELKAVARGIALLDEVKPNWFTKFREKQFDLSDPNTCALGSVYGEYTEGLKELAQVSIARLFKNAGLKLDARSTLRLDTFLESDGGEYEHPLELDGAHYGFEVAEDTRNANAAYERMGEVWLAAARTRRTRAARRRTAALHG